MGVTKLWEILKEVKRDVNLDDLKGQMLAVDLAIWVVEAEGVKMNVAKPYLRNLFYRVKRLMKAGIRLVFVIDGVAPQLKLNTIAERLAARGHVKKSSSGVRSRLNARFKECCILLDSLGIPWIKAEGEAEALCAAFNKYGLVDAVVTNDGDSFLCGAQTVYRNFSVDTKDNPIECYRMSNIEKKWKFDQRGMVALGLLLGCDYCPKGVPGIGVAQAVKLMESWVGKDALEIFQHWRKTGIGSSMQDVMKKPPHCSQCHHQGLKRDHNKGRCDTCGSACRNASSSQNNVLEIPCSCPWHIQENRRQKTALEDKVKSFALKDPSFPDQKIIQEFLKEQRYAGQSTCPIGNVSTDCALEAKFHSKTPTLDIACKYISQKLEWPINEAVSKVLPMLTGYHLNINRCAVDSISSKSHESLQIELHRVVKARVKDHVPSFDVKWSFTDKVNLDLDSDFEAVTLEAEDVMKKLYPQAVQDYHENIEQEKEEKKKAKSEARKLERKKKKTGKTSPKAPKITDFFNMKKARRNEKVEENINKKKPTSSKGKVDIAALELSLSSLTISKKTLEEERNSSAIHKNSSKTGTISKTVEITAPVEPKEQLKIPSQSCSTVTSDRPSKCIVIFSSDSEDSDVESEENSPSCNDENKPQSRLSSYKSEIEINSPMPSEITFSNELDFSLGFSMMQTPICKQKKTDNIISKNDQIIDIKASEDPDMENGISVSPLREINVKASQKSVSSNKDGFKTPVKLFAEEVTTTDSPVFMTLMERLKARKV